ncbi:MAG TPA: GNAT family N-acetyltransferase [Allosphingosinicella sp.]|nr:GNAT family N-acetyltransferase [Allosphingosinicella sp.]
MTGEVPVLETERLRLRPFRHSDLEPHAATLADPEVVRHLSGTPHSREESWRRMLCAPGLWALLGYGYWAVERRVDGAWLGQVGFADFKRDMMPSIEGLPEMGWIFAPHAQGQGFAGEAVAAALAWADRALAPAEIVAIISHGNAPSIRVAERAGFAERSEARYRDEPILLFRRRRPDEPAGASARD